MIQNNKLLLSKIGSIKIKIHRIPIGTLKTCIIIRDIDRWFACITTTNERTKSSNKESIGIDVGLTNWLTLSNGEIIDRPRFRHKSIEKINQLQRELAKKKKGSKNREKVRIRLAKAWRKVRLQREDYCHKVSNYLAKKYNMIVFEKLRIGNMVRQHTLATSIYDSTWGQLKRLAAYKAEVIEVDPYNTTQICSNCERKQETKLKLSDRIYKCQYCGLVLDRDVNAAKNILKLGQELALVERKPLSSSSEEGKLLSMKQETIDSSS
jgi:putative transposase